MPFLRHIFFLKSVGFSPENAAFSPINRSVVNFWDLEYVPLLKHVLIFMMCYCTDLVFGLNLWLHSDSIFE